MVKTDYPFRMLFPILMTSADGMLHSKCLVHCDGFLSLVPVEEAALYSWAPSWVVRLIDLWSRDLFIYDLSSLGCSTYRRVVPNSSPSRP